MRSLALAAAVLLFACARGDGDAAQPADAAQGVETRPPNASGQAPAFPGQTRAPLKAAGVAYQVETVASGLRHPWAVDFLPDGRLLVTERGGHLRVVNHRRLSPPVIGVPPVDARRQGGLLDVAVDPDFARNRLVYWSYAEPRGGLTNTAVARGRLTAQGDAPPRLEAVQVIFRQAPPMDSVLHYGSRLVFARDGTLFVTLGERSIRPGRRQAQRLDGTLGKIVRINRDGSVPRDNPFVGVRGARPEIYSIGHRNIQAAALDGAGRLWEVEHGARGGDELNLVAPGEDYGWPTISYGIEYAGGPIGRGLTQAPGMQQPVYYWDPVIAPSGMAFYEAGLFPAWKGSLFVGALAERHLARLTLSGGRVVGEERLLEDLGERIRDVAVGPDGALYVVTDETNGRVLRLTPRR